MKYNKGDIVRSIAGNELKIIGTKEKPYKREKHQDELYPQNGADYLCERIDKSPEEMGIFIPLQSWDERHLELIEKSIHDSK